ncbi:hypothetical protein [Aureivirga sp. CE67]|uniref:hypothetical protein n=1 Tax=Aureivirga sp. CE67 TaxID=1788983 RepID=UPI0018CBCFD5|nr:hypothetical protein [Aureivirga sp. CE67]
MKKLLLSLAIVGTLFSCSEEDDSSSQPTENSVIGTYKLTSATANNPIDLNGDQDSDTDIFKECGSLSLTISFSEGNIANATHFDNYYSWACGLELLNGTYTVAGNGIAFTAEADRGISEKETVNSNFIIKDNTLELSVTAHEITNDNSAEITYVFTKQ